MTLLQSGKAAIDLPAAVEQAVYHCSIARLIGPEIVVETAILLKDYNDVADLGAQALQVGPRRRLRAHQWRELCLKHSSGTGGRNRGEKFSPGGS